MKRKFFTISEYVDKTDHISASEKIIAGRTDLHVHEFFEIEFAVEGGGKQVINEIEYELSEGTIFLLTPGTFHKIICTPEIKLINIMFDETVLSDTLLPELIGQTSNYLLKLDEGEYLEIKTLAKILISNLKNTGSYNSLFINNIINCIIIKILRGSNRIQVGENAGRHAALNGAIKFLYKNFNENPPLKDVASMFGYSPNYFSKIFTEFTGRGYIEFLNSLKIAHAKLLLSSGTKTVSEIAFCCGFSSLSNFYRVFRDETGVAPIDYRKRPQ